MKQEIICAGFGGQGIMLLGKLMAYAAMTKGLHTTWMPSYGAEVRGGAAYCMVIISDEEIASPVVSFCDTAIIMNKPSLDKFARQIKPKGTLILNSSLVDGKPKIKDIKLVPVPMTEIAHSLGNANVANSVALGVYMKLNNMFSKDTIIEGIRMAFPANDKIADVNKKALEKGMNIK
jgi:2-oxoglutarate ferredoxin oxidoreductase subunit gamma